MINACNRFFRKFSRLSARYKFILVLLVLTILLTAFTIFQTVADFYFSDSLSTTMMFREPFQLHTVFVMDYHTFLFKLPFFFVEQKIGLSLYSHVILSLIFTMPMFGCFAYIFYRLTKRYYYTALALAGLMMLFFLIPPQYTLNNMTMPSMRNIEYGMFFLAFYWLYTDARRSRLILSLSALVLLIASDPMFAPYAIGASLIVSVFIWARRGTPAAMSRAKRALGMSILSTLLGVTLLRLSSIVGLVVVGKASGTTFVNQLTESADQALDFFIDALRSILATLGIDVVQSSIFRPETILAIICVAALFGISVVALRRKLTLPANTYGERELYTIFAVAVVGAAIVSYTLTQHVSGGENIRFFHIALFSLFISVAYGLSVLKLRFNRITHTVIGLVFAACSLSGIARAQYHASHTEQTLGSLHGAVTRRLMDHNIHTIAGDYWHIYPITARTRAHSQYELHILPLTQRCSALQTYFIDARWMPDRQPSSSFAVVAYVQPVGPGYDYSNPMSTACTHLDAIAHFGKPLDQIRVNPIPDSKLREYYILVYPTERLNRIDTTRARAKLEESYQF